DFLQQRVLALRQQPGDIGDLHISMLSLLDRRSDALERRVESRFHFLYISDGSYSTGSVATHLPFCSFLKKQFSRPVWQAMPPTCSTLSSSASASQSMRTSRTFWTFPDSSPLRQSFFRERDQ